MIIFTTCSLLFIVCHWLLPNSYSFFPFSQMSQLIVFKQLNIKYSKAKHQIINIALQIQNFRETVPCAEMGHTDILKIKQLSLKYSPTANTITPQTTGE